MLSILARAIFSSSLFLSSLSVIDSGLKFCKLCKVTDMPL